MAMTNKSEYLSLDERNALAIEAKADKEAELRLWFEVERFADKLTAKYRKIARKHGVLSEDDYKQTAFLGFMKAVEKFDPEKAGFLSHMKFAVMNECRSEFMRMSVKTVSTVSLDATSQTSDGGEGNSMIDFMADITAEEAFESLFDEDTAQIILAEAKTLTSELHRKIIYEHVYLGRSLEALATQNGIAKQNMAAHKDRAMRHLLHWANIRTLLKEKEKRAKPKRAYAPTPLCLI
jgi:RNA polymerase sigma factor (sigma-70 family)